jgi:hypothetical protein
MKITPSFSGIFAAAMLAGTTLHGQTADLHARLNEIRELLKPTDSDSPDVKNLKVSIYGYSDQWQRLLARDELTRFSDYAPQNLGGGLAATPSLMEKIQEFTKSVTEEVERRDEAKIAEAEALLSKVAETLMASKKAEDLDAIMLTMSEMRLNESGSSPKLRAKASGIINALQITRFWQEYLIADEAGNTQDRRKQLEQVSAQLASNLIVPRSFVLRLIYPKSAKAPGDNANVTAVTRLSLDDIKTQLSETGDSAAALAAVKSMPEGLLNGSDHPFVSTLRTIEELRLMEPSMAESEV